MILSGLSFIVVNFFVKILGAGPEQSIITGIQKYPAHELVLARSIVSFSICFYIIKQRKLAFFGNNIQWLVIRGIAGTIALTIFFYTLHEIPLAIAATIQYLSPIFTVLIAGYFLKERVRLLQWLFILVSFAGVILIALSKLIESSDPNNQISFFWLGMGVLSSAFSGLAYTAIIRLKNTDEPITIVMYFPMIAGPLMLLFCFIDFTMPQGIEWLLLLTIGIFTQLAQIALTKALHGGDAAVIMPFQYIGAIYAFTIGYFLFDETLSLLVDLGIVLIVFGVIANVIIRNR